MCLVVHYIYEEVSPFGLRQRHRWTLGGEQFGYSAPVGGQEVSAQTSDTELSQLTRRRFLRIISKECIRLPTYAPRPVTSAHVLSSFQTNGYSLYLGCRR
jgi:hypothetical protein